MSGHSPGPWSVQGDRDDEVQELHVMQDSTMDAEIAVLYPQFGCASADIADARLIAAAPDLLEAANSAYLLLRRSGRDRSRGRPGRREVEALLRSAIQKAQG